MCTSVLFQHIEQYLQAEEEKNWAADLEAAAVENASAAALGCHEAAEMAEQVAQAAASAKLAAAKLARRRKHSKARKQQRNQLKKFEVRGAFSCVTHSQGCMISA